MKKTEILQSMDAEFLKDNKNNGAKESKWLQKHSVVLPRERQTVWFQGTSACSMLACGFARPLLDWEIFLFQYKLPLHPDLSENLQNC
ncbi:MAG: hypothetical protein UHO11_00735 [Treponema sp.]|nr:hypothetical protein [Treponema sp.]